MLPSLPERFRCPAALQIHRHTRPSDLYGFAIEPEHGEARDCVDGCAAERKAMFSRTSLHRRIRMATRAMTSHTVEVVYHQTTNREADGKKENRDADAHTDDPRVLMWAPSHRRVRRAGRCLHEHSSMSTRSRRKVVRRPRSWRRRGLHRERRGGRRGRRRS